MALALLWQFQRQPGAFWSSAIWGALAVLVSHRWLIGLHPLDWIGVPLALSLPLCVLLLLLCAALGGLLVAAWSVLAVRLQPDRLSTALLLSALWGLAEVCLARSPLFWIGLGGAVLPGDPPLAALARIGGAGLVAALQVLIGWLLWRLAMADQPRRRLRCAVVALLVLLALHGLGLLQLAAAQATSAPAAAMQEQRLLLVQPAIPTREKQQWTARRRLERQLAAALGEAEAAGADLVLLPEGALGLEPLLAAPAPVELISGGFRWQASRVAASGVAVEQRSALLRFAAGERRFSSALDKHRLVPLGEWVPFSGLVRWSGLSAVGGVEPGPPSRLLDRPGGALAGAICYEIADATALRQAVRAGAGWLLASANLDPYPPLLQRQFTALAQLRAIESGRWLVSVANTGPSQLIDPRGRVLQTLPAGVPATGLVAVPALTGLTPYGRWGELPLQGLALLGLALLTRPNKDEARPDLIR